MSENDGFSKEQQNFLQGFAMGTDVARAVQNLPIIAGSGGPGIPSGLEGTQEPVPPLLPPEAIHHQAQDRAIANGGKLCAEEEAKRNRNALDLWDEMVRNASQRQFPKGTDVFLYKFHGLFYVAPAQDAFMCRLRIPGGAMKTYQMRGVAELARKYAGGSADVTTRANLQMREIQPADTVHVLTGLQDLGIVSRGSGGDNVRNVTASPTSGMDPQELIETLPLAKEMHHHILNHRELYGLPRKFNIAFEGGGRISSLEDTNDIGFTAIQIAPEHATEEVPAGVWFQLTLGGITGHKDFARPTGVLVKPEEAIAVSTAILRVFIANGDRTDRKKARLKYVLDDWGFDRFLQEVEKELGNALRRFPLEKCSPRNPADRFAHVGFHPQRQEGMFYVGVVLPVGRMTAEQMEGLADIADCFGNGEIRLTVWQNLLIPHIAAQNVEDVKHALEDIGLAWQATSFRAGLVACTGNAGCKFAATNTKAQAMSLARHLEERVPIDVPINVHLTGCPNSCAQHYIGDIGLLGTGVDSGEDVVEGYHVYVGGGYGTEQAIGRELFTSVAFDQLPELLERMLLGYLQNRIGPGELFHTFTQRHSVEELRNLINSSEPVTIS